MNRHNKFKYMAFFAILLLILSFFVDNPFEVLEQAMRGME